MTTQPTAQPESRVGLRVALPAGAIRAGARIVVHGLVAGGREAGSALLAGLDGVAVGIVLAYLVTTTVSAAAKHLGVPWPLALLIAGVGAAVIVAIGAVAGVAIRWILLLAGRAAGRVLWRIAPWRRAAPVHRVAGTLTSFIRGLPAGWLGALAGVLAFANLLADVGPLGLFVPAGALGPYAVVAGFVVGLAWAARRIASVHAIPAWRRGAPRFAGVAGLSRGRRAAIAALSGAAVAMAGYGGLTLAAPGAVDLVPMDPALAGTGPSAALPSTVLDDPGAPGPFSVRTLTYGSGSDRRPEFGDGATLRTPTVDATPALRPLGWGADEARRWFWGFGPEAMPINGRAWLPVGSGPFPLVLVVHGNHEMGDFSDPGYAYLGEHLASRGFITVSVDENFVNGSWAADWGGSEQLVRAWLLLVHLDQWRTWSADPASPLHGLVDPDRVALMGHSRGGEAAAVAASLADREVPPAAGLAPWPTGLHVDAVVAIAPSDGQYGGARVILKGTDYLTLHGGHDSDATSWMGIRQYARTVVEDGGFKAALWSYRSNHGQFSTVWGRSDHGPLGGAILNLAPIQDPADQRDVAMTAIGAFLEASLHDRTGYRDLFRRPMAGREWLPADDIYLVRSMDDRFTALLKGDALHGVDGVTIGTAGLDSATARALPMRDLMPDQLTRAAELRWAAGIEPATWTLDGLAAVAATAGKPSIALHLSLANGRLDAADGDDPLDPLLELTTADGITVALPLSRWGALPPPLEVHLVKDAFIASLASMDVAQGAPVERVLQSYVIPFAEFAAADPRFDPSRVATLRLLVDRRSPGSLWVAEVGLVGSD